MSQPVLSLYPKEKVGYIIDVLMAETFSGFPIIEPRVSTVVVCNQCL